MDFERVITLLQSIKGFRVNDELPFNTVDYLTIDDAIEFLSAQQGVRCTACPHANTAHVTGIGLHCVDCGDDL